MELKTDTDKMFIHKARLVEITSSRVDYDEVVFIVAMLKVGSG